LTDLLSPHVQWDALGTSGWDKSKGSNLWQIGHNGRLAKKVYKPSYITVMRTKQVVFNNMPGNNSSVFVTMRLVGDEQVTVDFDFQLGLVDESFTSEKEWLRNAPGVIFYLDLMNIEAKVGDFVKFMIDNDGIITYQINGNDKISTGKQANSDVYIAMAVRDINCGIEIMKVEYK